MESLCEPYAVRVARTVTRGVRVYTCSVVVGPTHPLCSMIYGSTGATHFDQLAKILTGYEITGARSSGILMGILSIAVGSLFKITAVPLRAAVGRTAPIGSRVGWVVPLRLWPILLTARGPGLLRKP